MHVHKSNISVWIDSFCKHIDSILRTHSVMPTRPASSASISSRRLSKQNSAPSLSSAPPRPSASFAARQSMLGRPMSIITPLPGFQEALLAQMEQLNKSNVNDPKSKAFKHLKRQSIRLNLVSQNKGSEFDWGNI